MFYSWIARLLVLLALVPTAISAKEAALSHLVLVTVAPYKYLVERIAGDTVKVQVIVPSTANVHTFEPIPRQMMSAAHADLWFRIGEFFEGQLGKALQAYNPGLRIFNMSQGLDLITGEFACCPAHASADLHYWLSPRLMQTQAKLVADALIARYPENAERYRKALDEHLKELQQLDKELTELLAPVKGKSLLVGHPAYGYLCRDYGLNQLSIETEGKDPTPQQLTQLLQKIKRLQIKTVFTQIQYSPKVAELIRGQLGAGAKVMSLDPYAEDYMQNMRTIARDFVQA